MNEEIPSRATAAVVAWDPKSPATLLVPSLGSDNEDGNDNDNHEASRMMMHYMLSDTGVGCNAFESSAIMKLLDARDGYLQSNHHNHHQCLLSLSKEYRKALATCILEWSEDSYRQDENEENFQDQDQDLLKTTHAITHLSEIFLLMPANNDNYGNDGQSYNYYSSSPDERLMGLPGAVTAETIRCLRLHYLGNREDSVDPKALDHLYSLFSPDLHDDDDMDNGDSNLYWDLIEGHIIRGCLDEAWTLLSHHSIVRRFMELDQHENNIDDYQAAALAEDREGFKALKSILLSAPIPGGRNSDSDDGFEVSGEKEPEQEYIEGISNFAYRLWETNTHAKGAGDYLYGFEPTMAYQIHQHWKESIGGAPALDRLRRRIPQLNRLLSLLEGNFQDLEFESWQEELCAELLYKTPNIALVDIHFRASALVQKHSLDEKDSLDDIVLTIMKGNSGEAIRAMHELGGGSGAALPATITSLLSQLLCDAKVVQNPSEDLDFNTELLIAASSAIRSSLATEGHHDLGTRLATRLLVPYIEIDSDLRITATLVDALEHHTPNQDEEAYTLISLCRKLVERKNVRVLDGCISICLGRHLFYTRQNIPGGAVHWLLMGIELESLVLCDGPTRVGNWQRALALGVCYRKLVAYFTETSQSLLKTFLGEESGATIFYEQAQEMVKATKEDSPHFKNNLAAFIPAVKVLENVLVMAGALVERKDNSIVANAIISCLEERPDDEDDGVVSSLAPPSMKRDLLRLALLILEIDVSNEGMERTEPGSNYANCNHERSISSFDVRGMGVLLSTYTIETKSHELRKETTNDNVLEKARLTLGKGLKRAFVAENSMKKVAIHRRTAKASTVGIYPSNFSKHSREQQEQAVQRMLEY